MLTKRKVLIIKLGHSETLDPVISKECSLGDVVRTTVILNYFRDNDNVTWLIDEEAKPLLEGNPYIDRILIWDFETCVQLQREHFDIVVNLEKTPGVCALSDNINAWQKYGFRFSYWHGRAEAYTHTEKVLAIATDTLKREDNTKYWQEHLAKVIDKRWSIKDKYIMKQPEAEKRFDIGLNFMVGGKWPEKAWPTENWQDVVNELMKRNISCSLQRKMNLHEYLPWIASCKTIVSCDSLGMHLAIAYGINVIALFGPTPSQEVYLYDKGTKLVAENGRTESITVEKVLEAIDGNSQT